MLSELARHVSAVIAAKCETSGGFAAFEALRATSSDASDGLTAAYASPTDTQEAMGLVEWYIEWEKRESKH